MGQEPKLVKIHVCQGLDLAHIYKSKLEAAGIPVLLQYDSAGPIFGIVVDGLGQVRILVPEEFADEATELLQGTHELDLADAAGDMDPAHDDWPAGEAEPDPGADS